MPQLLNYETTATLHSTPTLAFLFDATGVVLVMNDQVLCELNGFLHAMEWMNHKPDHGYSFAIERVESATNAEATAARAIEQQSINYAALKLQQIAPWRPQISEALDRWLLAFRQSSAGTTSSNVPLGFETKSFQMLRSDFLASALDRLAEVVGCATTWRIDLTPVGFYECAWEDYLFFAPTCSYWLHLGVSD